MKGLRRKGRSNMTEMRSDVRCSDDVRVDRAEAS
jgi:hypothetical protein